MHKHNKYHYGTTTMLAIASDSVDSRGSVWVPNHIDRVLTTADLSRVFGGGAV